MGGRQLLDPRWHWLRIALQELYEALDDDASPASLTIIAVNDQEMISYSAAPGSKEITRLLIASPSAMAAVADAITIDVTPDHDLEEH